MPPHPLEDSVLRVLTWPGPCSLPKEEIVVHISLFDFLSSDTADHTRPCYDVRVKCPVLQGENGVALHWGLLDQRKSCCRESHPIWNVMGKSRCKRKIDMNKLRKFTRVGAHFHVKEDLEGKLFSLRALNKNINCFLGRTQEPLTPIHQVIITLSKVGRWGLICKEVPCACLGARSQAPLQKLQFARQSRGNWDQRNEGKQL